MHPTHSFRGMVAALVLASILTVSVLWLLDAVVLAPESAQAQTSLPSDVVLHAAPRNTSGSEESFIFHKPTTGEIWVYRDQKFKYLYRLTELGKDMEKVK